MRNTEYTMEVLNYLRQGKSQKEIAILTRKHKNTVYRHVNWLRQNFAIEPQLLTNQTLQKIQQRLNEMTDRDLIHFLSVLLPTRIEAVSLTKEVIENRDITIVADYTAAISNAAKRDIQAIRAEQQVDTADT